MFAKQTTSSASLVAVLACASVAHAEGTGTFEVGVGYRAYEGFIARTRVANHYLALDASISARRQDFSATVVTPERDGLQLRADLFDTTRGRPGLTRQGTGSALTLEQQLGPNLRAFAGVRIEEVTQPLRASLRTLRAGLAYATDQTTVGMDYELSDRRLGSDYTFDRMHAWFSHQRPLGPVTLHLAVDATHMLGDVPRSERRFLDGVADIRGYAPGALAPLGATTKVSGRVELEVPLWRRVGLSAVGFADAGALGDSQHLASGASAGAGLMWRTPIGTLRFDWAVPLDGGAPRFLFGIGGAW